MVAVATAVAAGSAVVTWAWFGGGFGGGHVAGSAASEALVDLAASADGGFGRFGYGGLGYGGFGWG